jgi:hypothetical protein
MRWLGLKKRERGGPKPRFAIETFAAIVGVDVTTARRWLRGAATPDRRFAERLRRLQKETRATEQRELFTIAAMTRWSELRCARLRCGTARQG